MMKSVLDYTKKQRPAMIAILLALIESWEGLRFGELKSVTGLTKTRYNNIRKICLKNDWIKNLEDGRYIIQQPGLDAYQSHIRIAIYKRDIPDEEIELGTVMVPLKESRIKVGLREYTQSRESGYCRVQSEWPDDKVDDAIQEVMNTVGSKAMARDGFEILNALNKKGVAVKNLTFCWAATQTTPSEPVTVENVPVKLRKSKKSKDKHISKDTK